MKRSVPMMNIDTIDHLPYKPKKTMLFSNIGWCLYFFFVDEKKAYVERR
jgi:hypothetical protein